LIGQLLCANLPRIVFFDQSNLLVDGPSIQSAGDAHDRGAVAGALFLKLKAGQIDCDSRPQIAEVDLPAQAAGGGQGIVGGAIVRRASQRLRPRQVERDDGFEPSTHGVDGLIPVGSTSGQHDRPAQAQRGESSDTAGNVPAAKH